jgi:endonuclease/exonuclease/phosphatase family metal-dependent hydrolase
MIVQTKMAGEQHFMFIMVYLFARVGTCKIVTLRPVGLRSYVLKQSPCLFLQSIGYQIVTLKISLKNSIEICRKENAEIVVLGDFNVDYQQKSTAKLRLQTFARAFSHEQLITSATRITQSSKSIIDLIFANNIHRVVASGVHSIDISDHSLIFLNA